MDKPERVEQNFNHKEFYAEGGKMKEAIDKVRDIAVEHGCPVLVIAAVEESDDGVSLFTFAHGRNGRLPPPMLLAVKSAQTSQETFDVLLQILQWKQVADDKISELAEQVMGSRGADAREIKLP